LFILSDKPAGGKTWTLGLGCADFAGKKIGKIGLQKQ